MSVFPFRFISSTESRLSVQVKRQDITVMLATKSCVARFVMCAYFLGRETAGTYRNVWQLTLDYQQFQIQKLRQLM